MKATLILTALVAAVAPSHAAYLRLAGTNLAVTNDVVTAGEPFLSVFNGATEQQIAYVQGNTGRLAFSGSELVIQATNDGTPTPFLEIAIPNNNDQFWSFHGSGLVRNVGQAGWCLAAVEAGGAGLTMRRCDDSDALQRFHFASAAAEKRGSSPAEVVARAVAARE